MNQCFVIEDSDYLTRFLNPLRKETLKIEQNLVNPSEARVINEKVYDISFSRNVSSIFWCLCQVLLSLSVDNVSVYDSRPNWHTRDNWMRQWSICVCAQPMREYFIMIVRSFDEFWFEMLFPLCFRIRKNTTFVEVAPSNCNTRDLWNHTANERSSLTRLHRIF